MILIDKIDISADRIVSDTAGNLICWWWLVWVA